RCGTSTVAYGEMTTKMRTSTKMTMVVAVVATILLGMMSSTSTTNHHGSFFLFVEGACDFASTTTAAGAAKKLHNPHNHHQQQDYDYGDYDYHGHDDHQRRRYLQEEGDGAASQTDGGSFFPFLVNDTDADTDADADTMVPTQDESTATPTTEEESAVEEGSGSDSISSFSCVEDPLSPVTGLTVDLRMISRQTRASLTLESNCRMSVEKLEVYYEPTANTTTVVELEWYGALSLDPLHVANATLLSSFGPLNATQQLDGSAATTVTFATEYDLTSVGAILLVEKRQRINNSNATEEGEAVEDDQAPQLPFVVLGQALIQKLVPGPAKDLLEVQPTMFDNCWTLSDTARIRWTIVTEEDDENDTTNATSVSYIEVGMEYVVPFVEDDTWMAFGPAATGVQDRLMGGSDVVIAGFRSNDDDEDALALPFAEDYYIGGYEVCTKLQPDREADYDGVCRDSVWLNDDDSSDDVELLYSHTVEGVAFLRYRRPLSATTEGLDHAIVPGSLQNYVWARGPLDPSAGIAEVQFHGYQFGELKGVDMNEPTWICPPLTGVLLDGDDGDLAVPEDDEFTDQFEFRTMLEGDVVEVLWTLLPETSQIRIGARANLRGSNWMSVAIGDSMTDAWAWVATTPAEGEAELLGYRMSGLDATTVVLLPEADESGLFAGPSGAIVQENGLMSFEVVAQWPLPGMNSGDSSAPFIWALGPSWSTDAETPRREDEHTVRSKVSTRIDFATGSASAGKETSNAMLLAHGAMMWIAWLVAAPLTGIASRFIRDDKVVPEWLPIWVVLHKRLAFLVMILSFIGLVLAVVAVSDAGLQHILSPHAALGVTVLCLLVVQNFLGMQRPSPDPSEGWHKRRFWEYQHRIFAFAMLILAIAATITGSNRLESFDSTTRYGVQLTVAWLAILTVLFGMYELRRRQVRNVPEEPVKGVENDDEQAADVPKPVAAPQLSPWLGSWSCVYMIPGAIGTVALVVLAVVTFTDMMTTAEPSGLSSDAMEDMNITEVIDSEWYVPSTGDAIEGCLAKPQSYVGDGWCDDHTPYNTESCGWDGGDCCDITAQLYNCKDPESEHFGKSSTKGWTNPLPAPRNPRYAVDREETLESWVVSYNNYYEFGLSKDVVEEAQKHKDFLAPEDWFVDISGLVENPMTVDVKSLINEMHLEERIYRHRCVEAWSITSEWIGFPLVKLLDMVRPLGNAEIVRFTSWKDFKHSIVQENSGYPWPYTEALTMDEARNELTMVTVGAFGKPLEPQSGAPIRLNSKCRERIFSLDVLAQFHILIFFRCPIFYDCKRSSLEVRIQVYQELSKDRVLDR
ncbi:MAG: hypothetical protein SGILL_006320, partial [Bacillariaceae sp.]